jgi:hypothetical protein
MAIEIVDLPSYKMVIFYSYVSLPEGNVLQIFSKGTLLRLLLKKYMSGWLMVDVSMKLDGYQQT